MTKDKSPELEKVVKPEDSGFKDMVVNYIGNKLNPDTDIIEDVKFKTYGCGSAIASSSMFVDMLKGITIEQAKLIKDKDIAKALDLPPIKIHCSVLAEDSISKAISDWEEKKLRRHNGGPDDRLD